MYIDIYGTIKNQIISFGSKKTKGPKTVNQNQYLGWKPLNLIMITRIR